MYRESRQAPVSVVEGGVSALGHEARPAVEIGRDFEPKSKTRFGPRSNALRNDERWKVSDTLLPFDPRELEAVL